MAVPKPENAPESKPGKKPEKRKRNILKAFRLNEEELAAFDAYCLATGLSGGDLFRTQCCKKKALKPPKRQRVQNEDELLKFFGQIGRFGNNLNQIAHAMNVAKFKPDAAASLHALMRYEEMIEEIQESVDRMADAVLKVLEK